ncbi:hypothetical protein DPMN_184451 [Dreissena polymorpha]|uniref:Uncharacterized protein n=1 Tax=Dreissena polymorpha TaxID=45954 RepID=A0A9D4I4L6_DREPO|nr:hypothetical protein DPMN_184451 [Dreissena polymorpha]
MPEFKSEELVYPNVEGEELILTSHSDANDRQLQALVVSDVYLSIYTAKRPLEHHRQRDIIESVSWEEPVLGVYGGDNENAPEWGANPRTPDR